ncbi:23733_t:CDS:2 [Cetraspora pellucida]|uniref:23733_t:CDS:1 n=1 Tax=Cetraspora pellucida TaxID=1433469 RepID=A0A9N9FZA6_9GLOM|nr:23733_t:CDS:2 [Cetraspora pellucida]
MSKVNKSQLRKLNTDNQSILTNLDLTGLIDNVVKHAKSRMSSSNNNNSGFELQMNFGSGLQEPELQESECMPSAYEKSDSELSEEFGSEIESKFKSKNENQICQFKIFNFLYYILNLY